MLRTVAQWLVVLQSGEWDVWIVLQLLTMLSGVRTPGRVHQSSCSTSQQLFYSYPDAHLWVRAAWCVVCYKLRQELPGSQHAGTEW
jgi:hypothetical protein